ncbi:MAG TPA: S8 family serine peptidase [Actinopolymorphaceae bacterium]|jgi:type VII secretion-associated serine protease mycosin
MGDPLDGGSSHQVIPHCGDRRRGSRRRTRTTYVATTTVAIALALAPPALAATAGATTSVTSSQPASARAASLAAEPLAKACERQNPQTPITDLPWAQTRLQYDRVHEFATGRNVTIAVVDTGVTAGTGEAAHPQLVGVTASDGADFVPTDPLPATADCEGHGTRVAGIIVARPGAEVGMPDVRFRGIAPHARIVPVRVSEGVDTARASELTEGIRYAIEQDVDIINVSIVAFSPYNDLRDAIAEALSKGIVVVVAAGNTRDQGGNAKTYPAAFAEEPGMEGLIVVGATDQAGQLAPFSTTSVPVSVVAPGVDIISTAPINGHNSDQGTSFAAPFVSGTAALVLERFPDLTPLEVKRRLELTADHPGVSSLPAEGYGYGTVNPYEAVTAILPEDAEATPEPRAAVQPIRMPPPPDNTARNVALIVSASALGLALATLGTVATYRRGRARNWRAV